jgi:DNA-binding MarR family transcriptional regulator
MEDNLKFLKLMTDFSFEFKRAFKVYIEQEINITYPQWRVIKEIKFSNGNITAKEISDNLNADKVTISDIVNRLANKGYLVKEKDINDNRRHIIKITSESDDMCEKVMKIEDTFRNKIFENLSDEEIKCYINTTEKLLKTLQIINRNKE